MADDRTCRVCKGTREHKGQPCHFCDDAGRALHWCRACRSALPLCDCFRQYREVV